MSYAILFIPSGVLETHKKALCSGKVHVAVWKAPENWHIHRKKNDSVLWNMQNRIGSDNLGWSINLY